MKKVLNIFVQEPFAFQHWVQQDTELKLCFDLFKLINAKIPSGTVILIQLTGDRFQLEDIQALSDQGMHIIALSNTPNIEEGTHLFKIGVKGYLHTRAILPIMQQALDVVENGGIWLGQMMMNAMIKNIHPVKEANTSWKKLITAREIETLENLLKGMNNKEIATELGITGRTVKAHIHALLEKLDARDRLGLVLKVQNWTKTDDA